MIRCGVDIVYIPSIEILLTKENFLKKMFHVRELAIPTAEHLAGVIAAKEAFFKALGIIPKFEDIQVSYAKTGKPKFILSPQLQQFTSCDVSISHDKEYAIAFVVVTQ